MVSGRLADRCAGLMLWVSKTECISCGLRRRIGRQSAVLNQPAEDHQVPRSRRIGHHGLLRLGAGADALLAQCQVAPAHGPLQLALYVAHGR